jgi:hypothetical protein
LEIVIGYPGTDCKGVILRLQKREAVGQPAGFGTVLAGLVGRRAEGTARALDRAFSSKNLSRGN